MRPWETVYTPTSQARVHKITKCCALNGVPRMLQNFMCHKWASVPLQTFSQVADMGVAMTSLHALTTCCDPVHMEKQLGAFEGRYRPVSRSVYCTRSVPLKKHNHIVGKLCGLHSHHWHVAFLTTPFNLITSESQSDARCGFMYFFTPDYACWASLELDTCWIFGVMPVDTLSNRKETLFWRVDGP